MLRQSYAQQIVTFILGAAGLRWQMNKIQLNEILQSEKVTKAKAGGPNQINFVFDECQIKLQNNNNYEFKGVK